MPKAFLETEDKTQIPCMFNPADISVTFTNSWEGPIEVGKGVMPVAYKGASAGTFSLTLFFDTTGEGKSVTKYTDKLLALMEVRPSLPGSSEATGNTRPQWVKFKWGQTLESFKSVITQLQLKFDYFSPDGLPLRATAVLQLKQFEAGKAFGPQNPTSGTPNPHSTHRVQPGETLDRIAAMHFGDSTKWRRIADSNGIEDPLALRAGQLLAIPELH